MTESSTLGRALRTVGVLLIVSTVPPGPSAAAQAGEDLGGYEIVATGMGFTVAPSVPAVLPVETPVEGTLALALATLSTGGLGYGLASSVYPGTPIVGLRPLLEVGTGTEVPIPDYPIVVESREHEEAKSSRQPGITMASNVDPERSTVTSDLGGFTLPGIIDVGSVRTVSISTVEAARAEAVTETEVHGIDILAGALHIDTIATVASAETDSTSAACSGGVTISGATAGDMDITIDESGIHASGESAVPLPSPDEALLALLEATGVEIRSLGGAESCDGDHASRTTAGVLVSIPLPAVGALPPGGHLDIIFGSASARALATPAFEFELPDAASDPPTIADIVPGAPSPASGGNSIAPSSDPPEAAAPAADPLRPVATAADPLDYTFAGVPAALAAGLMLLAFPGSRRIRRYLDRVLAMAAPS